MTNPVVHTRIKKVAAAGITDTSDTLATEEPLEIRLVHGPSHNRRQQNISVTMRTPGEDKELAAGFLFTEGIINSQEAIQEIHLSAEQDHQIATVHLKPNVVAILGNVARNFTATAACGVCGKTSAADIHTAVDVNNSSVQFSSRLLFRLPSLLRHEQALFATTGGLHAAALVDQQGQLLLLREDIGRHNAVDKIIGAAMAQQWLPLKNHLLLLSGRAGFELIQKAAAAGIPVIAAIGAPSSMAVKMATQWNITLLGFLKEQRFNIYTHPERIGFEENNITYAQG
ncbi:MAG: formate dehydrogenase accessory sulfurtransferase FdhD [Chitinophaga sp.]|uniref:formate dehydrogenase accessory sulfurtransferase FdhD n=1 Tax=Chitinophaga sp. TaxID=1869181 RepID=UPI001B037FE9|nr:formate dehydrogenase accessory sulfurtransferase FdhD [Chitinophaga sp.]MBO9731140.1 formate dehydrogenase accessory sulfurtransferase FdhD [Chitinophaga sp.]